MLVGDFGPFAFPSIIGDVGLGRNLLESASVIVDRSGVSGDSNDEGVLTVLLDVEAGEAGILV